MRPNHRFVILLSAVLLCATSPSLEGQQSLAVSEGEGEGVWCRLHCAFLVQGCLEWFSPTYCDSYYQGCLYHCDHPEG